MLLDQTAPFVLFKLFFHIAFLILNNLIAPTCISKTRLRLWAWCFCGSKLWKFILFTSACLSLHLLSFFQQLDWSNVYFQIGLRLWACFWSNNAHFLYKNQIDFKNCQHENSLILCDCRHLTRIVSLSGNDWSTPFSFCTSKDLLQCMKNCVCVHIYKSC